MIPRSPSARIRTHDDADWRRLWREAVTDPVELLQLLRLETLLPKLPVDDAGFALRVPRGFIARMRPGDPRDPLLLQVLPQCAEQEVVSGFVTDAVGDLAARTAQGVLHKYHGRALLIASGSCAINCRYCFRRHFPYGEEIAAAGQWRHALEHVRRDHSIRELILSGGDPLALADTKLGELAQGLRDLPHIRSLRIHTRLPVVLPERIDEGFMRWFAALPLRKIVVLHANHPQEFDDTVDAACARLREAGALLLNQTVLLRDINDTTDIQCALSERLLDAAVTPYYLHQLDHVQGAAHFEVDDAHARQLIDAMRARLPGYLVPRLIREIAGETYKHPL